MTARVIHVASGREWRGGQNQVRLLARALAHTGEIDQVVVTGRGSELAMRLTAARVPVTDAAWGTALDPRALLAVLREARSTSSILHAHDAHALVIAGIAARLTGARLVVTRRVDFHLRRPGFWARADRVIAISRAIRDVLISDGIAEDRISVVHSGIDPAEVRSAPRMAIRAQLGLAPNLPLAVNVAALVPHKDHATLIGAARGIHSQIPDLHWVIAGEGPLREELRALAREAGLDGHVHFLGHVSNPWGLIREADVFVMSSKEEGLGTSVLDAMALGIPVAATRAGGIPEMLENGAGELVPVGDGASLALATRRLIMDPAVRERTLEAASRQLTQFLDSSMADGVRAVYRSILPNG
jgi:glycosyltransferase involved in cell wall biosynthesis